MIKNNTQKLVTVAMLLAICIVSQFLKNLSVYITGPIVNTCLIIAAICCGQIYALILSVVTPVTAFLITGNPLMSAIPLIIPCIMIGNALMISAVSLVKIKINSYNKCIVIGGIAGSLIKSLFMTLVISYGLIPSMIPEKMMPKIVVFQTTFSVTQLITALIGTVYALIIWNALKKVIEKL